MEFGMNSIMGDATIRTLNCLNTGKRLLEEMSVA
jgi:hypothetical protein